MCVCAMYICVCLCVLSTSMWWAWKYIVCFNQCSWWQTHCVVEIRSGQGSPHFGVQVNMCSVLCMRVYKVWSCLHLCSLVKASDKRRFDSLPVLLMFKHCLVPSPVFQDPAVVIIWQAVLKVLKVCVCVCMCVCVRVCCVYVCAYCMCVCVCMTRFAK